MEKGNEGAQDTVLASVSYTLSENVENLRLDGTANLEGTGNDQNNVIVGNVGNNRIRGFAGSNILHGDNGDDTLEGGSGLDRLYGEGGNDLLRSFEASDTLDGGTGNDQMEGSSGNDVYIVDEAQGDSITELMNEGIDLVYSSVSYILQDQVENLILTAEGTPGQRSSTGVGNGLNNYIRGNAGDNPLAGLEGDDTLNGQAGADLMGGGAGNDTYVVDEQADRVVETAEDDQGNQGIQGTADKIISSVSIFNPLAVNVEQLELTGSAITGNGNDLNNFILGNAEDNRLYGLDGHDTLDGGSGDDTLEGGDGNDIYLINQEFFVEIVESSVDGGYDTVISSAEASFLSDNVETLRLVGSNAQRGDGNDMRNLIVGNEEFNTLDGQGGIDTLIGGAGGDTYVLDVAGEEVIEEENEGIDRVEAAFTYTLANNVENLSLYGMIPEEFSGIGNELANVIEDVNPGNNTLSGEGNNDTLEGGEGNEILNGGEGNDLLTDVNGNNTFNGGGGNDSIDGGGGNNSMNGDAGNDTLSGGQGNDTLRGGSGNDTYRVVSNIFNTDTINDVSGAADTLNLSNFSFNQIRWAAVDTNDADNFVQDLRITVPNGNSILIQNYFDDTSPQASQSGTGVGLIESIILADRTLTFANVRALAQTQALTLQGTAAEGSTLSDADVNRIVAEISAYTPNNDGVLTSQEEANKNPELLNLVSNQG